MKCPAIIDAAIISPMYINPEIIVVKEKPCDKTELVIPQINDPPINAIIAAVDAIEFGSSYLHAISDDTTIIKNDMKIEAITE